MKLKGFRGYARVYFSLCKGVRSERDLSVRSSFVSYTAVVQRARAIKNRGQDGLCVACNLEISVCSFIDAAGTSGEKRPLPWSQALK